MKTVFLREPDLWSKGETPICAGSLRDGYQGRGKRDEYILSNKPISRWPKKMPGHMKLFVKEHSSKMRWNSAVATAKIFGLKLNNEVE